MIDLLAGFEATLHEVSGLLVHPVDDEATGTCVCVAHHITRDATGTATDLILHGRYTDRFTRDAEAHWRFATRELHVLWTEKRPVRLA